MKIDKNKIIIWSIIAVVVITVLIFIYKKGKKAGGVEQADLPKDGKGVTLSNDDKSDVRRISDQLYRQVKDYGFDDDYLTELNKQSDTVFVAVYNDFNTNYYKEIEKTLKVAIDDEWFIDSDIKKTFLDRCSRLNLA